MLLQLSRSMRSQSFSLLYRLHSRWELFVWMESITSHNKWIIEDVKHYHLSDAWQFVVSLKRILLKGLHSVDITFWGLLNDADWKHTRLGSYWINKV